MRVAIDVRTRNLFLRSVLGGVLITFGAAIYLSVPNRVLGAVLFSFGLLGIFMLRLGLYTGKAGYLLRGVTPRQLAVTFAGNLAGTLVAAVIMVSANPRLAMDAKAIWDAKTAVGSSMLLFTLTKTSAGMACGALMFIAAEVFNRSATDNPVAKTMTTMLAVTIFIVCGFEHSIADLSYAFMAMPACAGPGLPAAIDTGFIVIVALGNLLGSVMFSALYFGSKD